MNTESYRENLDASFEAASIQNRRITEIDCLYNYQEKYLYLHRD